MSKKNTNGHRLKMARESIALTQSDVAERIGTTQINVSRWETGITTPGPYYRQKLTALFGKSLQELGLISGGSENFEKDGVTTPTIAEKQATSDPPQIWNVPFHRNAFFTGREDIIDRLHRVFTSYSGDLTTQIQAISGLGGIGKSQIAIEYAYRYRDQYAAIFWINASTHETLSADFVILAALLKLPEQHEQDQDTVVRAVKRWMTTNAEWLLILDNVNRPDAIIEFLPMHLNGNVLITTREQASGAIAQSIEVDRMILDEGVRFLLARSKVISSGISIPQKLEEQKALAADIYIEMDGLPLALDQAGAYIEETRCGLFEYIKLYGTRRKELLLRRGRFPTNHPNSVATTWSLSFQQVEQESPAAVDLLHLLAFLEADNIPEDLITQSTSRFGQELKTMVADPFEFNDIIELLLRFSLIRRNPETKSLSIHHLVQAVLKDGMDQETQRLWAKKAVRALNSVFPEIEIDPIQIDIELQNKCQRYIRHVQVCLNYIEEYSLAFSEAAHLFSKTATYLISRAQYNLAEPLLLKSLNIRQKILDAFHPDTAHTLNDLGALYLDQGRYKEAEPLLEEALAIRQKLFGEEDVAVAQTLNSLANSYRKQANYKKAEPLYLRALNIRLTKLGEKDNLVAESYYGLVKLYNNKEEFSEAERYCQLALHIREYNLGIHHPKIASTLNMLAKIYQGQNKLERAKEINQRALKIRESSSGLDHPHVGVILSSIAEIYHTQGKFLEAQPLIIRAMKIYEQSLGQEHLYMAYSWSNRAKNLLLQGDYVQAEAYYKKTISLRKQHLDPHHPLIASTYADFAELRSLSGQEEEAEALYKKALSIREHTFGPDHPIVSRTLKQLATILRKQKKESEAEELEIRYKSINTGLFE